MELELSDNLKHSIGIFSESALQIIKKYNSRITCIVIQLNKDKVYIGSNTNGSFEVNFYDPIRGGCNKKINKYVNDHKQCVYDCRDLINKEYENNRMRSFNIFFNGRKKEVYVCKNRLGSVGMNKCKLFKEFKVVM